MSVHTMLMPHGFVSSNIVRYDSERSLEQNKNMYRETFIYSLPGAKMDYQLPHRALCLKMYNGSQTFCKIGLNQLSVQLNLSWELKEK